MIKIEGLSKFFRTEEVETIALNKVSLEVKDGEFVAVISRRRSVRRSAKATSVSCSRVST